MPEVADCTHQTVSMGFTPDPSTSHFASSTLQHKNTIRFTDYSRPEQKLSTAHFISPTDLKSGSRTYGVVNDIDNKTDGPISFYLKTNGHVPFCELKGPRDGFNMLNREEAQLVGETSQSAAMQDSATRSMTGLAVPELRREVLALTDPNVFRASVHRTGFL